MAQQLGPQVAKQRSFVVRVLVKDRVTLRGTGTLIRNDLVLTSYSLVKDGTRSQEITVKFLDGFTRKARVVKTDRLLGLALLKIKTVLYPAALPAQLRAQKRDVVTICGLPITGQYAEVTGKVVAYRTIRRENNRELFLVNNKSIVGMPGGPVVNKAGDIVGVLYGSWVYSNCTDLLALKSFLADVE
jgi:S1-C subfamily serine protease